MHVPSLLIGLAALAFGVITLILRFVNPESFGKLKAMQDSFGKTAGTIVHVVACSVLPILLGLAAIFFGMIGKSFF
jgi:hypothetical protein